MHRLAVTHCLLGFLQPRSSVQHARCFSAASVLAQHAPERVVLVQGASRGLGLALTRHYLEHTSAERVYATCRAPVQAAELGALARLHGERLRVLTLDVCDEGTVESAAAAVASESGGRLDLLLNVAGVLHDDETGVSAERKASAIDVDGMLSAFRVNAIGPVLMAKHFGASLERRGREDKGESRFVNFSARVGSIGDNHLGGWYSYRASKAAANQLMRTLGHELGRKGVCVVSCHPGTVDTDLTRKFLTARAKYEVQPVDEAAARLAGVFASLRIATHGGGFVDHRGEPVPW